MKKLLLSTAFALAMSVSAMAGTMNLMLDQDSGTFTQTNLGAPGQSTFTATNAAFGNFNIANITGSTTGTINAPLLLTSNTLDVQQTGNLGPHRLDVWISANDLTAPLNLVDMFSGFTNVALSNGWIVNLETLLSTSNEMFTGALVASDTFIGALLPNVFASTSNDQVDFGSGPYSLTAHYTIFSNGPGEANSGITVAGVEATPLPAAAWMFMGGAGLGGFLLRKRKKKATAATTVA